MNRENEFWTPEPLFRGQRVFVLASGPSLTEDVCRRIEGQQAIAVNSSCRLAPWAAVLFFTDNSWFEARRAVVAAWPGLAVSLSKAAKRSFPDRIRRVQGEMRPDFPPVGAPVIRQGRSSGHSAVSLAVGMGAPEIVLLGFDMRVVDGREHCHQEYLGKPRDLGVYAEFLRGFEGWGAAARKAGVSIVNATPASALTEFPTVDLDDVLRTREAA